MSAPHPDQIRFYMQQYRCGCYKEFKKLLRKGYRYPVTINVKNYHQAITMINEQTTSKSVYNQIFTMPKYKTPGAIVAWFQDAEIATMVKLEAG